MGEKSKKIGEIGENIAENFFSLIGWHDLPDRQTIPCVKPAKHARPESKKGKRETHGIDFLHSYKSPLESNTVESIIISVKHTEEAYKTNPKETFKAHALDLAQTLECYKNSELKAGQLANFKGVTRNRDTGVLFWISSNDDTYDDVISKIANSRLDADLKFEALHVVDNKTLSFIFETLTWLRSNFKGREVEFYYPETALSYIDKTIPRAGHLMPVEFLTSPILPFLVKDPNGIDKDTFCFSSADDFDQDTMRRLIQASREYTHEISCDYLYLFPNFVESHHADAVTKAQVGFDRRISTRISVKSYQPDFRSLNRG